MEDEALFILAEKLTVQDFKKMTDFFLQRNCEKFTDDDVIYLQETFTKITISSLHRRLDMSQHNQINLECALMEVVKDKKKVKDKVYFFLGRVRYFKTTFAQWFEKKFSKEIKPVECITDFDYER